MKSKFKVGDLVVRKTGGTPFKVHIVDEEAYGSIALYDVHLNKCYEHRCEFWAIYNSPLYHAMDESTKSKLGPHK